ncbi:MAG: hypothetical protein ACH0QD_13285 [Tepidibacillus sp.]
MQSMFSKVSKSLLMVGAFALVFAGYGLVHPQKVDARILIGTSYKYKSTSSSYSSSKKSYSKPTYKSYSSSSYKSSSKISSSYSKSTYKYKPAPKKSTYKPTPKPTTTYKNSSRYTYKPVTSSYKRVSTSTYKPSRTTSSYKPSSSYSWSSSTKTKSSSRSSSSYSRPTSYTSLSSVISSSILSKATSRTSKYTSVSTSRTSGPSISQLRSEASKSSHSNDINQAIDKGILKGSQKGAELNRSATGSEAAAFLFRAAGISTGNSKGAWDAGVKATAAKYGVTINNSKPIDQATLTKLVNAIKKDKTVNSNLKAFDPKEISKMASGGISREEMLLLASKNSGSSSKTSTPTLTHKVSYSYTPSTPSRYVSTRSTGSRVSTSRYTPYIPSTPPVPVKTPPSWKTPPSGKTTTTTTTTPTVTVSPAQTSLVDTPAEFKNKKNVRAVENTKHKYTKDIKRQLEAEMKAGKLRVDTNDKMNKWINDMLNKLKIR